MTGFDLTTLRQPAASAFTVRRAVRFQDVDAAGIVFFPRILEYCNDALFDFLAHRGHEVATVMRERRWALPLRHAEADFLAPLRFGDTLEVALARVEIEATQVTVGYRLAREGDSVVVAVGQTVHVFVDLEEFQRAELPPELRVAFAVLPGGETAES